MLPKQIVINMKIFITAILTAILTFSLITYTFFNCCSDLTIIDTRTIKFQTRNNEFSFEAMPGKSRGFKMMESQFEEFRKENPNTDDTVIYRIDLKNYLNLKNWCKYKSMSEWQYPYLPPWKRGKLKK